jgi:glycosyltransferase involved in cell wall biosynthesis
MVVAVLKYMSPLISIIIPTYNRVQYVTRAIAAIQEQAFTAWELIVVDDGSSDGTAEVLPSLAALDARIQYVRQANAGVSVARNTGMAVMHPDTRYIMFHDDDDWLTEDGLTRLSALAAAFPDAPAVVGLPLHCDDNGYSTDTLTTCYGAKRIAVGHNGLSENVPFGAPETFASMVVWCGIATPALALIRRDAFAKTSGFVTRCQPSEDWLLWLDLTRQGDIPRTGTFTLNKRVHPGAVTQNGKVMAAGEPAVRLEVLLLADITAQHRLISLQGYLLSCLSNASWAVDDFRNRNAISGLKQVYRMLKRMVRIGRFWATTYRMQPVVVAP